MTCTCVYCKGVHSTNACNIITKPEGCISLSRKTACILIVWHIVRYPNAVSNSSEGNYDCKHHTSLCTNTPLAKGIQQY